MEDHQLTSLWKSYDQQLAEARLLNLQSWVLNLQQFERQQQQKAHHSLDGVVRLKTGMVIAGLLWVALLVFLLVYSLTWTKIFFVVSAGAIALITLFAIVVYVQHIVWIKQIKPQYSVTEVQKKLEQVKASSIQITRILFLQAPFYCCWFVTPAMISNAPLAFWFITVPITAGFAAIAIWLYVNINIANVDKKWFRFLFSSKEWTGIVDAAAFLNEIEDFKKELLLPTT
jgi:hypothetical protein